MIQDLGAFIGPNTGQDISKTSKTTEVGHKLGYFADINRKFVNNSSKGS
jgi:hypothetical protein